MAQDDVDSSDANNRESYSTLLKDIQTLMEEVQKQRNEFRTEMRSLASSISRKHDQLEDTVRKCACSSAKKVTSSSRDSGGGMRGKPTVALCLSGNASCYVHTQAHYSSVSKIFLLSVCYPILRVNDMHLYFRPQI